MSAPAATPPPPSHLDDDLRTELVAKAFRTLGEPIRLRIVELLLRRGEQSVGELTDALPVSQPRVSVHLACLEACGFTVSRRSGRRVLHRISGDEIGELVEAMRAHATTHVGGLERCLCCGSAGRSTCRR